MQSVKDWENTKKYKNTNCIFGRNGKIQKNTKIQSDFFWYFICIFSYFLYFYTKKKRKTYQKNTNAIAQKYKIQEKFESTISKIQNTKKIRTQHFKNTKYKDKFKNKPESQPRVHFWKSGTKIQKKYKTNQLYFPNPAVLILYFWVVFFSYFFCIFNIGRRPFCSHPGQLKFIELYLGLRRINQDYGSCTKTVR